MALGDFHSRIQSPMVAMYLILCDYNMPRPGMLPFIFPVRKFFDLEVQVPVGSLARPVTRNKTHYDAGTGDDRNNNKGRLDHSSVPLILPNTIATTIAVTNMPVSI